MMIEIWDWGLGLGIEEWDQRLGLEIGIEDWCLRLGIKIYQLGDWDLGLALRIGIG